ncbi:hypothetical protein L6452_27166 [Arctium lappa]|uniref:Uncharacterized protein n=1 Tax=Arctium lappa TaxID=4217 RepID=A0ACB8ZVT6_ARCLA|nr:hypothetical protein L6452_27166 [Arctium lappa]
MAEPQANILPYDHPFDPEHYLLFIDDDDFPPLNFTELPTLLQQNNFTSNPNSMLQSRPVADGDVDPFILDDEIFVDGFQANPSPIRDETNIGSSDFGNPIQLSAWPLQVPPYTCSVEITKFEVHGRLGVITHGVLEKYGVDLTTNQSHEYKMFNFCNESTSRVKQYLEEYCKDRKSNGYVMLQDPLSAFYEAVCVGLDWEYNMDTDDLVANDSADQGLAKKGPLVGGVFERVKFNPVWLSSARLLNNHVGLGLTLASMPHMEGLKNLGDHQMDQPDVEISRARPSNRTTLSMQINSIERKISMKAKFLTSADAEERGRAQSEIDTFRQEIANIYARFDV